MTTGMKRVAGRFAVWPGILAPLGLTLLAGVAAWFFAAKVAGDRERADAAWRHLEGYAMLEARELAGMAAERAGVFAAARMLERRNQERNLRLEVRGVMDAVYRLLTAGLEKSRKNAASRRDVGRFPAGFEGVRSYLENSPLGPETDAAVEALRSFATELAALLPSGCSLAVIEDSSRELLSLGGGATPEASRSEAIVREFIFDDGGRNRHWALRVELHAPDAHPLPAASETARAISAHLASVRLDGVSWRGWLLGPGGEPLAAFPALPESAPRSREEPPPFIGRPGEWLEIDDRRLAWQERYSGPGIPDAPWTPSVTVAIAKPPPPPTHWDELFRDSRWSLTLGVLAALALGGWVWFFRVLLAAKGAETPEKDDAPEASGTRVRRRLVRNGARTVPEVQGVIVADIGPDGGVTLAAGPGTPPKPRTIPSGSLFRLQGIHRGREGVRGSRILDLARSPVLRELANRVRPPEGLGAEREAPDAVRPAARAQEGIASMKSVTGWKKVEDA